MDEEFFSSSRRLVEVSFTANATWVAPATTVLVDVAGRGQNGTPGGTTPTSAVVAYVSWLVGGSGPNPGVATWDNAQAAANAAYSAINSGAGSWTEYQVGQYSGGSYILAAPTITGPSDPGSASITYQSGWQSSGPITGGGSPGTQQQWTATVNYTYTSVGATTGASASAIGRSFPGGIGVNAVPMYYPNTPVTPGASYSIVAPLGTIVVLTYFE